MRFIFKSLAIIAMSVTVLASVPHTTKAAAFVIEDNDDGFTVAFPDSWAKVQNQKSDDKLTIAGPGENNLASCRVRVRDDKRFMIYPSQKFADDIQKVGFSKEFWQNYLGEYDDVEIDAFRDGAGLGRGHASMIETSYTTAEGTIAKKRGMMFATLYGNRVYIVDCSSEETFYDKWRPDFLGIIKSVDFKKVDHENLNGNYRDFQDDKDVVIQNGKKQEVYRF